MKRFIILSSVLISCVCFSFIYKGNTEKSTKMQHFIPKENENKSLEYPITLTSNTQIQEEISNTTATDHSDAKISLVNQQATTLAKNATLVNQNKNAFNAAVFNNELLKKKPIKEHSFYICGNTGVIYHDNSDTFVQGIREIGKTVLALAESDNTPLGRALGFIVAKGMQSIESFQGKIDFQWLNSASLGYHAGRNGKIDFEIMYSQVKIKNENPSKIFDETAGIFTFLLNLYYNPKIQNTNFSPYIGFGIGPTVFRLKKINSPSQASMPLNVPWYAYQVKLGIDYPIISNVKTFLGYRYFNIPVPVADYISTHNVELGLLFNF